jgi:hypothetical protein
VNEQVRHGSLVGSLCIVTFFLNRAQIRRQSIEVFDLVDAQLVKDVAVLWQL